VFSFLKALKATSYLRGTFWTVCANRIGHVYGAAFKAWYAWFIFKSLVGDWENLVVLF
jgi:hypothetical protein